jgi:hypothetical protein
MNAKSHMQKGKNWILPKEINANRLFLGSHWLEIWKNHYLPLWDRMEGAWLSYVKYGVRSLKYIWALWLRPQSTYFHRDETGLVCLPTQLERTLELYW